MPCGRGRRGRPEILRLRCVLCGSVFGLAGAVRPTRMRLRFAFCKSRSPEAKRSFLPLQEILRLRCAPLRMTERGAFRSGGRRGALFPDDGKAGFFRMTGGAAPAARDDGEACVFSIRRAHARPYKRKSCARMIYEEKPVRSKGRARFFPFPRYAHPRKSSGPPRIRAEPRAKKFPKKMA